MSGLSKKRSPIWNHFSDVDKDKAKCEYCMKIISYSGGGTGNLTRHMKKVHGSVCIEQPSSRENLQSQTRALCTGAEPDGVPSTSSGLVPSLSEKTTPGAPTPRSVTQSQVQPKINAFTISTKPLPLSKTKQLDEQIVKFIVKSYHSFAIVEEEEFKNMYRMILPNYTLPTRKTIS